MFTLMRRVHLVAAGIVLSFLTMYFVTGYPMIHRAWFPDEEPTQETRRATVELTPGDAPEAWARAIQRQLDLRGKRGRPRALDDGRWRLDVVRPGWRHRVTVAPGTGDAEVVTRREGPVRRLIGMHRLHGYGGGSLYTLWAVFYDLACLSLVVFAATGVYLWYKLAKRRLLGWLLLAAGFVHAAATIAWLVLAP